MTATYKTKTVKNFQNLVEKTLQILLKIAHNSRN